MSVKVIDNFLDKESFENLKNSMLGPGFPWYYTEGVIGETDDLDIFQFVHIFWDHNLGGKNSERLIELKPIIDKISPKEVYRIKANITVRGENHIEHGFHTDYEKDFKCTTAILYMNTNDGYTVFEDGLKIESIENRFVYFDSNMPHSGSNCTDQNVRCVINFNYNV